MSKFSNLISQIELFIRKYYKNKMVKGAVIFVSIFILSFLIVSTLEYFGRFGNTLRTLLFYSFLFTNVFVFIKFIAIPLFKLNKVSKRLTMNEASVMIGSIFPDISDKLQNTLQLSSQLDSNPQNIILLQASIEQKSNQLSAIPFTTGIKISENKKYLKFLLPLLLILGLIALIKPTILSDSTERIVNYNQEFIIPAPFQFNLISNSKIVQGDNYKLQIKMIGNEIPTEVTIHSNLGNYNLKKASNTIFEHEFTNVNETILFTCESNGFTSQQFVIDVLQKPSIDKMTINLLYPKHTQLKNESINNIGDLTVPEGTFIDWKLTGLNTTELMVLLDDTTLNLKPNLTGDYSFKYKAYSSIKYQLVLSSQDLKHGDTLSHNITVIPDAYPQITIIDSQDSLNSFRHFIEGTVSDDYGFKSLVVSFKITRDKKVKKDIKSIKINRNQTKQFFYYELNYADFDLSPGDKLEYAFTITDNDAVNNFKSSTSLKKVFAVPTLDSLDNLLSENNENLKNDIDKAKSESDRIKEEVKKIKNDLINKQSPDWKDKQNLENLLNMQESLQKKIDHLKQDFEQNKMQEDEFLENSEELTQKQEELQKLLDELMDDEMRELMEELQKLMDEMNKDQLIENLEQMENKTETMEQELDRTLELFKNLELDKKLESIEEQLKELAEQQKALQEQTENKELSTEELAKKQDEINKKFDEIQKDIQEAKDKNENLDSPRDLDFDKEMENSIEEQTNESKENLENGKSKKSQQNQKNAAEMMEQMADDIGAMKMSAASEQAEEDMDAMRFLLENIINLSHQEEALMKNYKKTRTNDPNYLELNRNQLKIKQSTEIVNDSLLALSKRVYQLSSFINDELSNLNYSLDKTLIYSEERKTNPLMQNQQYAITAYNNLALMLSEVLDQMQQQQKSKMQGKGSCSKPGGQGSGQVSSPQMSMQQMKDQMKKQIEKMKGGQKPGGKDGKKDGKGGEGGQKPGGKKGSGIPGLSNEEIAKMAFQQSQMRKSLEQMRQELNKDGSGNGNMLNELIKDMEELENDLLNNNDVNNVFKRQQEILSKLLESEKAMQERGFSDKRESNTAKNQEVGNQIDFTEYNKKKNAEIELLKSIPVGLRVYYKNLVNEYFNSVNN